MILFVWRADFLRLSGESRDSSGHGGGVLPLFLGSSRSRTRLIIPFTLFCLLGSALTFPPAFARETLTLQRAMERALEANPGLRATRARAGVSEAEIVTAGARLNPAIVSDNGIAEKTYRLGVEQTVRLGGKRRKQVSLAQARRDVVLAEINTTVLDLRAEVRRAYVRLYNVRSRLKIIEEMMALNERLMDVARIRERAGDIAVLELEEARLAAYAIRDEARVARGEAEQALIALNALLGEPATSAWELLPPDSIVSPPPGLVPAPGRPVPLAGVVGLEDADLDALTREALVRRPEISRGVREMTVAERQLALARANRFPDVTLIAGPDWVVEPDAGEFNAFIIANVPVPLFNRQQGPISEARALRAQLEAEQSALRNRVVFEVASAHAALVTSRERLRLFETELLPTSENVFRMSGRGFEVGKFGVLVPIVAEREYLRVRQDYLTALEDYQNAVSDLERAVGTEL